MIFLCVRMCAKRPSVDYWLKYSGFKSPNINRLLICAPPPPPPPLSKSSCKDRCIALALKSTFQQLGELWYNFQGEANHQNVFCLSFEKKSILTGKNLLEAKVIPLLQNGGKNLPGMRSEMQSDSKCFALETCTNRSRDLGQNACEWRTSERSPVQKMLLPWIPVTNQERQQE